MSLVNAKKLHSYTEWHLTFEVKSPIHIGVQDDSKGNRLVALKDQPSNSTGSMHYLIPGSTFRGVARAYLSKLQEELNLGHIENVVSQLFGYTEEKKRLKGRIWLSDVTVPGTSGVFKIFTPIDRITAKALPLFWEGIKEGTIFTLSMKIDNASALDYGVVALLLRAFSEAEIAIGAAQTRGLGKIQLMACDTTIHQYAKELTTIDGVALSATGFKQESEFFMTKYTKKAQEQDMYMWLQPAVNVLADFAKEGSVAK